MTIYVVTSGCYSDYHIDAVYTDRDMAYAYANLNTDREVEEYESDSVVVSGTIYVQVQYNPLGNRITVIHPIDGVHRIPTPDTLYDYSAFVFQCLLSDRTKKDIEQYGEKSPLLLKAAQDRWARYKADHIDEVEKTMPKPMRVISPEEGAKAFFKIAALHNAKIEAKQNE